MPIDNNWKQTGYLSKQLGASLNRSQFRQVAHAESLTDRCGRTFASTSSTRSADQHRCAVMFELNRERLSAHVIHSLLAYLLFVLHAWANIASSDFICSVGIHLQHHHFLIRSTTLEQLLVASHFKNAPALQHHDLIGTRNRAQSMGNNKRRAILE